MCYKVVTSMEQILNRFETISLAEMGGVKLMNRTDTKFVTTVQKLLDLLSEASDDYFVQEIDGKLVAPYYTLYFDTDSCDMFRAHHNGKLNRQKLRVRSYVDSQLSFMEVKTKNNHGRTRKTRLTFDGFDRDILSDERLLDGCTDCGFDCGNFLTSSLWYAPDVMSGKIENSFNRVTLVNKAKTERLTIDTSLAFHNIVTGERLGLDGLAIIELKRDGMVASPVLEMLRRHRIKPMGFSKYCMGMALTDSTLRQNRFLPRLARVEKMLASASALS